MWDIEKIQEQGKVTVTLIPLGGDRSALTSICFVEH